MLLTKPMVSLIPQILESPASIFPYDPGAVAQYDAVILILQDNGEVKFMRPGHVVALRDGPRVAAAGRWSCAPKRGTQSRQAATVTATRCMTCFKSGVRRR